MKDIERVKRRLQNAIHEAESAASDIESALDELESNDLETVGDVPLLAGNLLNNYFDLPDQVKEFLICLRDEKPMSEHVPGFALLAV